MAYTLSTSMSGLASERPTPEQGHPPFIYCATDTAAQSQWTGTAWQNIGGGGSDPWTHAKLVADFTTTSATAVDVTGLAFAPAANTNYEFNGILMIRTATAAVNPRAGLAWPTGMTDGVAERFESEAAIGLGLCSSGNVGAALLIPGGGRPNAAQS